ncbi:MAG: hypothetical protein Ct9H300mP16_07550 [Pseudomonadota bacterium]|nr:MAG: hypothetical protein Ct9H300mP16_07550 [Pseudomonadota bacterium]
MLNVINGFYHPDTGSITFKGETRKRMRPHVAAAQGIARTFQNVALFKGMSTLDNIMTGRNLKMSRWAQTLSLRRSIMVRHKKKKLHTVSGPNTLLIFWRSSHPKDTGWSSTVWPSETSRTGSGACRRAGPALAG